MVRTCQRAPRSVAAAWSSSRLAVTASSPLRAPSSSMRRLRTLVGNSAFDGSDIASRAIASVTELPGGGGISATIDLLLLTQLGYDKLTLYDASMGEWARDPALPIETD